MLSDCVQFTILLEANRQCEARHETLKSSVPETTSSAHQHDSSPGSTTQLSPALYWEFKAILPPPKHQGRFLSRLSNRRKSIIFVILLVAIWKKKKTHNIHCIYTAHAYPLHLEQTCHLNHSKQKLQSIPEILIGYNTLNKCCQNIKNRWIPHASVGSKYNLAQDKNLHKQ